MNAQDVLSAISAKFNLGASLASKQTTQLAQASAPVIIKRRWRTRLKRVGWNIFGERL